MEKLSSKANDLLAGAFWNLVSAEVPVETLREGLVRASTAAASEVGGLAGVVAAQWYEKLRPESARPFSAVPAGFVDDGSLEATVRWAVRHVTPMGDGDVSAVLSDVQGALLQHILGAARETVASNAGRDPLKPRWARVPSNKPCAFCAMLASRGFVYESAATADGLLKKYHHDCKCTVVPGWGKNPRVHGYSPTEWLDAYEDCFVPGDYKETLANMRRAYPALFSDGVDGK